MSEKPPQENRLAHEITGLFVINTGLFVYSFVKLLTAKANSKSKGVKPNNKLQIPLLTMFCIAIFSRCLYQVFLIYYQYQGVRPGSFLENCFRILDNMPTLLFVTISCIFANIWHRVYSRFRQDDYDEDDDVPASKPFNLKRWLIIFNIGLYIITIILTINNFLYKEDKVDTSRVDPMHILFCICTILMTILLGITGTRFHRRTVRWLKEMGNTVKSTKGFKTMFIFLILCCIVTCLRQLIIFYCRIVYHRSAGDTLKLAPGNIYGLLHITYLVVVFIIGESLPFLLLIRLLDSKTKKSQIGRLSKKQQQLDYSLGNINSNTSTSLL